MVRRALTLLAALGLLLAFAVPVAARNINSMNAYKVTNLVSDTGVGGTLEDPLLVNACSEGCIRQLPPPPDGYVRVPHRGGPGVQQPPRGW